MLVPEFIVSINKKKNSIFYLFLVGFSYFLKLFKIEKI